MFICSVLCLAGTYNFRKHLPSFFLHKLTSINRQNWSCEKIPKSQNSDKAASFSSVVVNIASSVQKVSYSKPLHNKSRCLNTMKSFLAFKVISTWIFVYFQKGFTMKLWQNTQFTTAILFCFIFTAQRGEYNVIVRDSEPIRLLESPRSLSVYILIIIVKVNYSYHKNLPESFEAIFLTSFTTLTTLYVKHCQTTTR